VSAKPDIDATSKSESNSEAGNRLASITEHDDSYKHSSHGDGRHDQSAAAKPNTSESSQAVKDTTDKTAMRDKHRDDVATSRSNAASSRDQRDSNKDDSDRRRRREEDDRGRRSRSRNRDSRRERSGERDKKHSDDDRRDRRDRDDRNSRNDYRRRDENRFRERSRDRDNDRTSSRRDRDCDQDSRRRDRSSDRRDRERDRDLRNESGRERRRSSSRSPSSRRNRVSPKREVEDGRGLDEDTSRSKGRDNGSNRRKRSRWQAEDDSFDKQKDANSSLLKDSKSQLQPVASGPSLMRVVSMEESTPNQSPAGGEQALHMQQSMWPSSMPMPGMAGLPIPPLPGLPLLGLQGLPMTGGGIRPPLIFNEHGVPMQPVMIPGQGVKFVPQNLLPQPPMPMNVNMPLHGPPHGGVFGPGLKARAAFLPPGPPVLASTIASHSDDMELDDSDDENDVNVPKPPAKPATSLSHASQSKPVPDNLLLGNIPLPPSHPFLSTAPKTGQLFDIPLPKTAKAPASSTTDSAVTSNEQSQAMVDILQRLSDTLPTLPASAGGASDQAKVRTSGEMKPPQKGEAKVHSSTHKHKTSGHVKQKVKAAVPRTKDKSNPKPEQVCNVCGS
jgi:hypothetical protein